MTTSQHLGSTGAADVDKDDHGDVFCQAVCPRFKDDLFTVSKALDKDGALGQKLISDIDDGAQRTTRVAP
jgi:hypothetical protein